MTMGNMEQKFSKGLHKEYVKGNVDTAAISTLQKLKEKTKLKDSLFATVDNAELERYKELYPEAWAQVENIEAFQNLDPKEQAKVMFEFFNNGQQRPENPIMHHLDK